MTQELTLEQKYALLRAPILIRTFTGRTWGGTTAASRHLLDGRVPSRGPLNGNEDDYTRTRVDK